MRLDHDTPSIDGDLPVLARLIGEPALAGSCSIEEAERLQALFDVHAVGPFAAWSIANERAGYPLPEAWRIWCDRTLHRAKASAAQWMEALDRTLRHLRTADIVPIVLKGPDLALRYYPQPHLRLLTDLDLLFASPQQAEKAQSLLISQGYRKSDDVQRAEPWLWSYELPALAEPATGIKVEVHGGLLVPPTDGRGKALRGLVEAPQQVAIAGLRFRALSPEANAVYLFVHAFWHHAEAPPTLKALLDVRQIVMSTGEGFRWSRWETLALESGFAPACSYGLHLLRALFHLPDEALAERLVEALPPAPLALGRSRAAEEMTRLKHSGGVKAASRRVARQLFPGAAFLRQRYPEKANWSNPALHLYRLWQGVRIFVAWGCDKLGAHASKRPPALL